MRILYWTPFFIPDLGGIEVLSAQLLPVLQSLGHEFVIVTSHGRYQLPDQSDFASIPIHRFHFRDAIGQNDLKQIIKIRQEVAQIKRTFRPDLIHLHISDPSAFFHLSTLQAHIAPTLLSLHQNPDYYGLQTASSKDALLARVIDASQWVTAVSHSILEKLRQRDPQLATRSSVVYNGLPTQPRVLHPLPMAGPQILCIGRLIHRKGFDIALAAFALLSGDHPTAQLTIAGEGILRDELQQQAEALNLGDRVRLIGAIPPADVPALLSRATVVVVPSRAEGLPMVALEAGQMAKPVVAADFDGVDEVVIHNKTGMIVPREDSQALSTAISHLLSNQMIAVQLGQNAQQYIQETFSLDKTAAAYDSLYQQLYSSS
jgi:glycosyltransferase involved in cell wall biosynthesis